MLVPMRVILGLVTALATTIVAMPPGPASAVGEGDPSITSPIDGANLPNNWSGPIRIDMSNAPAAGYLVQLDCNDNSENYWDTYFTYDGTQDIYDFHPEPLGLADDCQLLVADAETFGTVGWDTIDFTVASGVSSLSASPAEFFPTVKDDYKDQTKIRYRLSEQADVSLVITNAEGRKVRSAQMNGQGSGYHTWVWNGLDDWRDMVKPGQFQVEVSAVLADGREFSATQGVKVASGWRTVRGDATKEGDRGSFRTRGNCFVRFDGSTAVLDCWGGRLAAATYNFKIPSVAKDLTWKVFGGRSGSDICCRGRIVKSATRPTSRAFRVRVQVSGWRAYEVHAVAIQYRYRTRI